MNLLKYALRFVGVTRKLGLSEALYRSKFVFFRYYNNLKRHPFFLRLKCVKKFAASGQDVSFTSAPSPLCQFPRATLWHLLQHYSNAPRICEKLYLEPSDAAPDDIELARRLHNSFNAMLSDESKYVELEDRPNSGIWEMCKHEYHGELYRLMADQNIQSLAVYMQNAMRTKLTHGLGPGKQVFDAMSADREGQEANILILLDRLASLAEALAGLPYENPEQGHYGKNAAISATELVDCIEAITGVRIGRPPVMGEFGILVNGQVIDVRVPDDVYTSWRICEVASAFGLSNFAEIGGGLGGTALQAIRFGAAHYTIFDLPVVNVVQGWFLSKVLGSDFVRLYGEPDNGQAIMLLPYWEFFKCGSNYDLIVNRDSLPEIPEKQAREYITEIARRGSVFLSINQEGQANTDRPDIPQLCVSDLVKSERLLHRVSRSPYWTRKGYVEELYLPATRINKGAAAEVEISQV